MTLGKTGVPVTGIGTLEEEPGKVRVISQGKMTHHNPR